MTNIDVARLKEALGKGMTEDEAIRYATIVSGATDVGPVMGDILGIASELQSEDALDSFLLTIVDVWPYEGLVPTFESGVTNDSKTGPRSYKEWKSAKGDISTGSLKEALKDACDYNIQKYSGSEVKGAHKQVERANNLLGLLG